MLRPQPAPRDIPGLDDAAGFDTFNLMVKSYPSTADAIDRTFAALADPTRRAILARVAQDDGVGVSDLAAPFLDRMSLPAVSKHLRVLEKSGLLTQERDGRIRRCHLQPAPLREAHDWVARYRVFWSGQLDALATFLQARPSQPS